MRCIVSHPSPTDRVGNVLSETIGLQLRHRRRHRRQRRFGEDDNAVTCYSIDVSDRRA